MSATINNNKKSRYENGVDNKNVNEHIFNELLSKKIWDADNNIDFIAFGADYKNYYLNVFTHDYFFNDLECELHQNINGVWEERELTIKQVNKIKNILLEKQHEIEAENEAEKNNRPFDPWKDLSIETIYGTYTH